MAARPAYITASHMRCAAAPLVLSLLLPACREKPASGPDYALLKPTPEAPVISTGSFRAGDSLETALGGKAAYAETAGIEKALKKAGARVLMPDDVYAVARSTAGAVRAFALARGEEIYAAAASEDGFTAARSSMPVVTAEREASGVISTSLWESMSAQGIRADTVMDFADVFAWKIDFLTEPRRGDRFALLWEERVTAMGRPCGIRIKAAVYAGEETGKETAFFSGGHYYDGEGGSLRRAFLRAPLSYRRISSFFSRARYHPVLRIYRPHHGIDYAAPSGTPVSAVADGTIVYKGWKGGYGNYLLVRHGGSYSSGYGHLKSFAKGLRAGARVSQGQVVAYVGSTGLSTGPHLDFSFKINGRFTDFLKFRPPAADSLSGAELREFKARAQGLRDRLEKLLAAPAAGK